jgi:hypothetical protein
VKITVEKDDGEEIVFQNITDATISMRQLKPLMDNDGDVAMFPDTTSHTWTTGGQRELVKELRQVTYELQRFIDGERSS